MEMDRADSEEEAAHEIPDERLRLIFTACHPSLDQKTQVALTLRTLCGLSTVEIARAFLDRDDAMAQRLVRARQKISKAGISYAVPGPEDWEVRLNAVLRVIYLIFNEGHLARLSLVEEAMRPCPLGSLSGCGWGVGLSGCAGSWALGSGGDGGGAAVD